MKKVLVPGLLVAMAMGLASRQANAGGFSIGISIGDNHRHAPVQVISAPPVIVAQPAPVCAPPVVVAQPTVVYSQPEVCAPAPVVVFQPRPSYVAVRECDRVVYPHYGYGWHGAYDHRGYEHGRSEHHRR